MIARLARPSRSLAAAAIVFAALARAGACGAQTAPPSLPRPAVVRAPVTYAWSARTAGTPAAGAPSFVAQGEAYTPVRTTDQRSTVLDAVTRERYADAMAKNRLRGAGVPVRLKAARF